MSVNLAQRKNMVVCSLSVYFTRESLWYENSWLRHKFSKKLSSRTRGYAANSGFFSHHSISSGSSSTALVTIDRLFPCRRSRLIYAKKCWKRVVRSYVLLMDRKYHDYPVNERRVTLLPRHSLLLKDAACRRRPVRV